MLVAKSSRRDAFITVKCVMKSESELAFNSNSAVFPKITCEIVFISRQKALPVLPEKKARYGISAEPLYLKEVKQIEHIRRT
jgi:hypothetical protein